MSHPLLPFASRPGVCPKCGGGATNSGWDRTYRAERSLADLDVIYERLEWKCLDCGFVAYTKTKDAEASPS